MNRDRKIDIGRRREGERETEIMRCCCDVFVADSILLVLLLRRASRAPVAASRSFRLAVAILAIAVEA